MRLFLGFILASVINVNISSRAHAQIDASSALMLNSGGAAPVARETTFDNGRYTIRPKSEPTVRPPGKRARTQDTVELNEGPQQPITVIVPAGQEPPPRAANDTTRVIYVTAPQAPPAAPPTAPPTAPSRELLPVEAGRRFNLIDLSFSPGFLYTNSDSVSFYRRYSTAAPTLNVDANLWFTPSFGLHGSFLGTLSGSVSDSFNGSRNVPASHQWLTAGVRTRKFFGPDSAPASLTFGIDYFEYEFRVPTDASLRNKLRSTGAQLSFEAELPATTSRSWTLGVLLAPKLEHRETATSANFSSGGNVEANIVGVSIGARYQFERRDALFWKISHRIEKDLFSGEATQNDPVTGITPTGVAVTNSFTLIELGYAWGN